MGLESSQSLKDHFAGLNKDALEAAQTTLQKLLKHVGIAEETSTITNDQGASETAVSYFTFDVKSSNKEALSRAYALLEPHEGASRFKAVLSETFDRKQHLSIYAYGDGTCSARINMAEGLERAVRDLSPQVVRGLVLQPEKRS